MATRGSTNNDPSPRGKLLVSARNGLAGTNSDRLTDEERSCRQQGRRLRGEKRSLSNPGRAI